MMPAIESPVVSGARLGLHGEPDERAHDAGAGGQRADAGRGEGQPPDAQERDVSRGPNATDGQRLKAAWAIQRPR